MGPTGCPETSVRNYYYSLRINSGERSSNPLRGGSLKSSALERGALGKQRRKLEGNSEIHRGEIGCDVVNSIRLISGWMFLVFSCLTLKHKLIKC